MADLTALFRSEFMARSKLVGAVHFLGGVLVLAALGAVFFYANPEREMGEVQRIFYFHVGSAMACYFMVGILFVSSVLYLVQRKYEWDICADASASVALVFAGVVLVTGMIWGHSAWNTWWRWEPRLISFLILWFILFGVVIFRNLLDLTPQRGTFAAVFGIVAALNVPVVVFSIKLLERTEQLHPQVVGNQGLRDSTFVYTLIFSIFALALFALSLFLLKVANILMRRELDLLESEPVPTSAPSRRAP